MAQRGRKRKHKLKPPYFQRSEVLQRDAFIDAVLLHLEPDDEPRYRYKLSERYREANRKLFFETEGHIDNAAKVSEA